MDETHAIVARGGHQGLRERQRVLEKSGLGSQIVCPPDTNPNG